jgi:hypothetical protein
VRIAYIAHPTSSNAWYRAIGPMEALAARGHRVTQLPTEDPRPAAAAVAGHDVLLLHRYAERRAQQLAEAAHAQGIAVVWDNDDDMGAVSKEMVAYRITGGMRWEQRLAGMRKIFRVASRVTAPSEALAARLREQGASETRVIENCIPDVSLHPHRAGHAGVTIGWIVGPEHQLDVDRIPIREALQRLLDERADVHVESIGLRLGLSSPRYRNDRFVPLLELTARAAAWDIGIAPLAELDFNRGRSNIKLKEYAAAGTPWLASPVGPYTGLGEKQGGRLVADERWYDELVRLIDKPRERRKLGKRAAKWAAAETVSKNAHRWEACFAEALDGVRAAA